MELETFDDLLTLLGTGKWNLYMFFTSSFMNFVVPIQALSGTFMCPLISHTCVTPNLTNEETNDDLVDACTVNINKTINGNVSVTGYKCKDFIYDNSTFHSTMTSEFGLICEYNFMRALYFSIYNLGNMVGSPVNGFFADKRGRKPVFILGSTAYILMSIIIAWLPNMSAIFAARFIMGFNHASVIQSGFLLATEVCQPKHRSTVGMTVVFPWALGTMVWAGMGYLIRDWRYLQMSCSIPMIVLLPFIWFVDEPPRWLIVRGKFDQALKVLEKAAKWNNTTLPPTEELLVLMNKIQKSSTTSTVSVSSTLKDKIKMILSNIFILIRTKSLRKRTLVLFMDFFVGSMVFYGMSINAVNFSADPYIYMALSGLMEVPSYTIVAPIIQKFGRKIPTLLGYLISGVSILSLAFIPPNISWLVMTLAMLGKFCISSSYQIIYLYCTELIPTEIRQFGLGNCNVMGRLGSIICPLLVEILGPIYNWMPSLIFGSLSIICGLVTFILPETLHRPIPDTLAEVENQNKKKRCRTDSQNTAELVKLKN